MTAHQMLAKIGKNSAALLEIAEKVHSETLVSKAQAPELAASGQLLMLTQRIGKSAREVIGRAGLDPDAIFWLGKDINSFSVIARAMLHGDAALRLTATKNPALREHLQRLLKVFDESKAAADTVLSNLRDLVAAREAQAQLLVDGEVLESALEEICLGQRLPGPPWRQ
jgi:twitching motility protein PilJ